MERFESLLNSLHRPPQFSIGATTSKDDGKMAWHVFIPDSLLEETDDPKIRTYKVGQVARACSIFGVEHIWIYRAGGRDGKFIKTVLEYAETPPVPQEEAVPADARAQVRGSDTAAEDAAPQTQGKAKGRRNPRGFRLQKGGKELTRTSASTSWRSLKGTSKGAQRSKSSRRDL